MDIKTILANIVGRCLKMTSEKGGDDTLTGVEMGKKEQKLKEITMIRLAEIS